MKILQLCKKFPYPIKDGEAIAINGLSKSLHLLGGDVTLLAMNTSRHYFSDSKEEAPLSHYKQVFAVDVDNRIKPWEAFQNLFSRDSYHITRFVSESFAGQLKQLLQNQKFDVVQLETLYLAPYIPLIRRYSDAVIALRAHNVEHEIWHRITENTRFAPKKWYLRHLTEKLRKFELSMLHQYDLLVAITERDLKTFRDLGYEGPAVVTPIGIDPVNYEPDYKSYQQELSIGFIGSLDWMPNIEGLNWFLTEVWPGAHRHFPNLRLHIAGRSTPDWLHQADLPNVVVHGEVPDARAFINQHSVIVVPLLSGSGMRAKILEAMALGKVVLTTSLGLEGIQAHHNSEVLIADTPDAFVHNIAHCYQSNGTLEYMGRKAQQYVVENYDSMAVAKKLIQAYTNLCVVAV